jgi:hypothetical protein
MTSLKMEMISLTMEMISFTMETPKIGGRHTRFTPEAVDFS